MLREESLPFEFSGKMARLLGRESVSSEIAALFELVKNAYDSDATNVKISFQNFFYWDFSYVSFRQFSKISKVCLLTVLVPF